MQVPRTFSAVFNNHFKSTGPLWFRPVAESTQPFGIPRSQLYGCQWSP